MKMRPRCLAMLDPKELRRLHEDAKCKPVGGSSFDFDTGAFTEFAGEAFVALPALLDRLDSAERALAFYAEYENHDVRNSFDGYENWTKESLVNEDNCGDKARAHFDKFNSAKGGGVDGHS